jgi:3',5'-cyclic AMP phosphodiesterase CpdA
MLVRKDAADVARKVIADIKDHIPALDVVIFTGDLADGGSPEDYDLLKEILSPLSIPVFVMPGNHDNRENMYRAFKATTPFEPSPNLNYEAIVNELRILALDTLVDGAIHGALNSDQLDWLQRKLQDQHSGPTIIAMHHPPFPSGVTAYDKIGLKAGKERLGKIIAEYKTQLIILAGHIHRPFQALWHGAFCQVSGGSAFQHGLDLRAHSIDPGGVSEPYSYHILSFKGSEKFINHVRYVRL